MCVQHLVDLGDLYWIGLCNLLAVCTNISVYGLIGRTSPVTYQVVGQLKTVLVVAFGYLFFDATAPLPWLPSRLTFGLKGGKKCRETSYLALILYIILYSDSNNNCKRIHSKHSIYKLHLALYKLYISVALTPGWCVSPAWPLRSWAS